MDSNKYSLLFMGTPEFAAAVLEKIIEAGFAPGAVMTQPDKPVGRKRTLEAPPVKKLAEKNGIPVWQPEKLRENEDIERKIRAAEPDAIIVAAYGKIIPKSLLDIPDKGCLNVHPSLLPKYRGPSPVHGAILNGDEKTGATIMLLDEEMDHGPILARRELDISGRRPSYEELSEELAEMGADLLVETLPEWLEGKIKPEPQDHSAATYTKMIEKQDGLIDWSGSAEEIERQVRAFHRWPVAFAEIPVRGKPKKLKVYGAKALECGEKRKPGEIFRYGGKMAAKCGRGCLIMEEVQPEGKNRMKGEDFLRGYPELAE